MLVLCYVWIFCFRLYCTLLCSVLYSKLTLLCFTVTTHTSVIGSELGLRGTFCGIVKIFCEPHVFWFEHSRACCDWTRSAHYFASENNTTKGSLRMKLQFFSLIGLCLGLVTFGAEMLDIEDRRSLRVSQDPDAGLHHHIIRPPRRYLRSPHHDDEPRQPQGPTGREDTIPNARRPGGPGLPDPPRPPPPPGPGNPFGGRRG